MTKQRVLMPRPPLSLIFIVVIATMVGTSMITFTPPVHNENNSLQLLSLRRSTGGGGSPPVSSKTKKSEFHGSAIGRVAWLVDDAEEHRLTMKTSEREVEPMGDLSCCDNEQRYKKSFWRAKMQYEPGCSDRNKKTDDFTGAGGIMNAAGNGPDWQKLHYPTCNEMHMLPFESFYSDLLGVGSLAAAYMIRDERQQQQKQRDIAVIKTYRYDLVGTDDTDQCTDDRCDTPRLLEKTRIDAMAMERLTKSPNVVNAYGHCGQSLLIEVGGKTLIDAYTANEEDSNNNGKGGALPLQKLKWGMQAARALSDVHSIDAPNGTHPTLAHGDVSRSNFLIRHHPSDVDKADIVIVANDFNQGYLLRYKGTATGTTTMCGVMNGGNHGMPETSRPPERYKGFNEYSRSYDKVDIFGLGVVLIEMLLEIENPFSEISEKELRDEPRTLEVPSDVYESKDISVNAVLYAALACMSYEPENRPTANQIAEGLQKALEWTGKMMTNVGKEEIKRLFLQDDQHFASLKLKEDSIV